MSRQEYIFKIDAFTPETLPMERLAEYMARLATLFGSQERVHFVRIEPGSVALVQRVESEHIVKVRQRLKDVKQRKAPQDATEAYSSIDKMLAEDNATGLIESEAEIQTDTTKMERAKIIEFPGRNRESIEKFGAVSQAGSIDGVLVRIGGTDETVPVLLMEEGNIKHHCTCSREVAKTLAPYLFGSILRVHGVGRWHRDDFGNWVMDRFMIHTFDPLDETKLGEVVSKLQSIKSDLQSVDDPLHELRQIRHGTE